MPSASALYPGHAVEPPKSCVRHVCDAPGQRDTAFSTRSLERPSGWGGTTLGTPTVGEECLATPWIAICRLTAS